MEYQFLNGILWSVVPEPGGGSLVHIDAPLIRLTRNEINFYHYSARILVTFYVFNVHIVNDCSH